MRVTLIISSLSCGGAERVMSIIANYWAEKGWMITLLTLDDGVIPPFYDLDPRIKHIPLAIAGHSPLLSKVKLSNLKQNRLWRSLKLTGLLNIIWYIKILRSAIIKSEPDIVISFIDLTNIVTLLATSGLNIPVIVSERSNPIMFYIDKGWKMLRWITYPFADRIVVQTKQVCSYFSPRVQKKVTVIPNPLLPIKIHNNPEHTFKDKTIVAIGHLRYEKGFDLLLQAFARLKDCFPEWTLTILGEGELRKELEHLRSQLGLSKRVHMPGIIKNPHEILRQADLFILSSRHEGFPNALCEAMACGLPVISTDCNYGPREIIRDGIDGILVPTENITALVSAMTRLIMNKEERKRLSSRSGEVTQRFNLQKIMEMWEEVITSCLKY